MVDDLIHGNKRSWAKLAQICVTNLATHMEARWGVGRLPMLVSPELRARFLKQQRLYENALLSEIVEDIREQSHGMLKAWHALDDEALKLGQVPLPTSAWQLVMPTGEIVVFVREERDLPLIPKQTGMEIFTADKMAELLMNLEPMERKKTRQWPNGAMSPIDWEEGDEIPL